ncbi:MAG: putative capsid protein [Cressdnaviricota sp.]|nr:MAG: putative capsid protein [Cressdnaviricota sp.]
MPLKRTTTIRPKSGVSSGTASRLGSSLLRQRSASTKAKALKRTASVRESAVIATAVSKAENAIFRGKEEKWFHVEADQQAGPQKPTGNALTNTSVLSFCTTSNKAPNLANVMQYCGHTITNLSMLRLYTPSNGDAKLQPYALDGKKATPTLAQIAWTINRNYVRNGLTNINTNDADRSVPAVTVNDPRLYENLPIRCRMIRVTPKLAPGVTLGVDPTTDLFLDQRGLRYSPNDASWGLSDNEYARVNTRNYTVLGDTKFTLGQPLTATWAANYLADNPAPDILGWRQDLTLPSKMPVKRLKTNHQLTAKKGGQCHYVAGSAGTTDEVAVATSGQRREYIFMHFWYECGDGSVSAGSDVPTLVPPGVGPGVDALKVHFRVESRFKEE